MEKKEVVFDGGPLDGRVEKIDEDLKTFQLSIVNDASMYSNKVINHFYIEDPKVPGHFQYMGERIVS